MVTISRILLILFPTLTVLKKASISIGMIIIILLAIFGMHIHEIIYHTVIIDKESQLICVISYDKPAILIYNRINVIIHHVIPFLSQTIVTSASLIFIARSQIRSGATSQGSQTLASAIRRLLREKMEYYITPMIIILSTLPQIILAFAYACTELEQEWQRHGFLVAYLLTYIPHICGFILYILPSKHYSKEFKQTVIGKCLFNKFSKLKDRVRK